MQLPLYPLKCDIAVFDAAHSSVFVIIAGFDKLVQSTVQYTSILPLCTSSLVSPVIANDLSIDSSANYNLVSVFVNNCVRQI